MGGCSAVAEVWGGKVTTTVVGQSSFWVWACEHGAKQLLNII